MEVVFLDLINNLMINPFLRRVSGGRRRIVSCRSIKRKLLINNVNDRYKGENMIAESINLGKEIVLVAMNYR